MTSYPEPIRSEMTAMLRDYLLFTVYRDWPAHREGDFLNGGGTGRALVCWTPYWNEHMYQLMTGRSIEGSLFE